MDERKSDIALIQPPCWSYYNPSLGLAILKSYLEKRNIKAKIFDLNIILYNLRPRKYTSAWELEGGYYLWERESFVKQIFRIYRHEILHFIYSVLSLEPKIIGLSTHCLSFIAARLLAKKFRQFAPEKKIIFGGPEVAFYTNNWNDLLSSQDADAIFFGEAEESLVEYVKGHKTLDGQQIKGVAYRMSNGQIILGGERKLIAPLDSLPFPDFSDFDLNLYAGSNMMPTYFSRGCINRCIYCIENKIFPKFRNRTGDRVFEEVRYLLSLYPRIQHFRFFDSVSNGDMGALERFCDLLISHNIKISFELTDAVVRKEMDRRIYAKLKKAGCTLIAYGLETPSKKLLKFIGKRTCLDADFDRIIDEGARSRIVIAVNMMFGLPGETEADFKLQLDFLKRHKKYRKYLLIVPALNYCYFPEGCAVNVDPDKYGVDISKGELFWSSKDGRNNFIQRMNNFEKFSLNVEKIKYRNLFGITHSLNKDELLGKYYYLEGNRELSLKYFIESFYKETKTLEVADEIISLYNKLALTKDKKYAEVLAFKEETMVSIEQFILTVNTREELNSFILNTPILHSFERLNNFMEAKALNRVKEEPAQKMIQNRIRSYIKRQILRIIKIQNIEANQKQNDIDFILFELLKQMDNKIDIYRNKNNIAI